MRRMKWMVLVLAVGYFLTSSMFLASYARAAGEQQTKCPVMEYPVNKEHYVDYKGKRIYFCCNTCPEEFKKDPDKYMKKLQDEGVILEDVPKK